MPERLKSARRRAVGAKQTLRALHTGSVCVVYVATDADQRVVRNVEETCEQLGVELVSIPTMAQVGKLCGIDVGAACAAIIEAVQTRHDA